MQDYNTMYEKAYHAGSLNNKSFLITGGAGLVGSHITDLLVRENNPEIIVLDNFVRGRRENLAWAMANGNVRIVEGEIGRAHV